MRSRDQWAVWNERAELRQCRRRSSESAPANVRAGYSTTWGKSMAKHSERGSLCLRDLGFRAAHDVIGIPRAALRTSQPSGPAEHGNCLAVLSGKLGRVG